MLSYYSQWIPLYSEAIRPLLNAESLPLTETQNTCLNQEDITLEYRLECCHAKIVHKTTITVEKYCQNSVLFCKKLFPYLCISKSRDYIRDLQLNGYAKKNGQIDMSDDFLDLCCNEKNGCTNGRSYGRTGDSPANMDLLQGSKDDVNELKRPVDFAVNNNLPQSRLNDIRFVDQFEIFPSTYSNNDHINDTDSNVSGIHILPRCFSSSLQEISDDSSARCNNGSSNGEARSYNLLPRPATAGSVNDFRRSQEYHQQFDSSTKYIDSIKNGSTSAVWSQESRASPPPPGLSTLSPHSAAQQQPPPSPSSPTIWDNSSQTNSTEMYLPNCNGNSWPRFKTYNSPPIQTPSPPILSSITRQLPPPSQIGRKTESRSDYLLQAVNALSLPLNNGGCVNRPLRSQRVDIRILYAMMYRALANGLAGGRREVCVFCRNNGEHELIYTSHSLKDSRNKVTCPILRAYQCPICLSTGDKAHTIKYCPYNTDSSITQDTPLEKLFRYVNSQQQQHFSSTNFPASSQNQTTFAPNGMLYSSQELQAIIHNSSNSNLSCGLFNNQDTLGVTDLLVNLVGQANTLTNNSTFDHSVCYPPPLLNSFPPPRTFRS
ncbi:hypothetical protein GJ496_000164 [Pomphorhynchus laevis]|nr:hypothetical protein GJ496_000164 [Pomphorhynchus laevis]